MFAAPMNTHYRARPMVGSNHRFNVTKRHQFPAGSGRVFNPTTPIPAQRFHHVRAV
jgi:hypothetical protein